MERIKVQRSQVKDILEAAAPRYRGRKIRLSFQEQVRLTNLHWEGGSRSTYTLLNTDGRVRRMDYNAIAPWDNPDNGKVIPLVPSVAVVEHAIFCGKDIGITIYLHPTNLPKWLNEGGAK